MKFDMKALQDATYQKVREVMAQREEILTAFIAKYGFEPDEIEQCEQRMDDGTTRYFVRKRVPTEQEAIHSAYKNEQLGTL